MAETSKWMKLLAGAAKFVPEAPWVAIVVEVVTHLTSAMGITSNDSKETLQHMESLRSEVNASLAGITGSHVSLSRQLTTQAETLAAQTTKLDALTTDLQASKLAIAEFEARSAKLDARLAAMEARAARTLALAIAGCVLIAVVILLLIVILLHQH